MMPPRRRLSLSLGATASLLAGCSTVTPARLDSFSLGRNVAGEGCLAQRNWSDPATPDRFARAYALTCSGVAANRQLGSLRVIAPTAEATKALDAQFDCNGGATVTLNGRPATARRCLDKVTGIASIRLDADRAGRRYVAAGAPAILGQLEEAIAIASGERAPSADVTRTPAATIDLAALPASVDGPVAPPSVVAEAEAFSPAIALARGVDLNHKGLHVEASRVLNDALSRTGSDTSAALRAELLLEAGLADSNIKFGDAARAHFAGADQLFAADPSARTPFLARKRDTYLALDALNRNAYSEALAFLNRAAPAVSTTEPLRDPEALSALNQPRATGAAGALAVPDAAQLSNLVLATQAQYARSVALLATGDDKGAREAIDAASRTYRPLANERLDQAQLLWLGARLARQRGRLQAREGKFRDAYQSYDAAVDLLRRGSIANAGTGNEPAIAEAELDRAAIFARTGVSHDAMRERYAQAIDALAAAGVSGTAAASGMEDYLDLLVAEAANRPRADTFERFFRAVQASGEPAVARQLTQLRTVATADPAIGAAVRERADLEREITRLRYAIAGRNGGAETSAGDLDAARAAAEARLLAVDAQLARDPRYRQVDESPATLAEVRAALRPGEIFFKLTPLDRRLYGMVVTADRTYAYAVADSPAARRAVDELAAQLRASIDGGLAEGKLTPFDEARAYTLFRLVGGPAAEVLASARSIVVDPAGPLERLPLGVLVTRYDPKVVREDPFDFSHTAFLANTASISTALSPRSFLVARALPSSRAPKPFLGFGEHVQPAVPSEAVAAQPVSVGFGCQVDYGRLAALSRALKPISARELRIAAGALGVPEAEMIGASFSDTGVEQRGDLDQFEVLHFATHGLEEGVWGCTKSPPALVTSFGGQGSDGLLSFSEIAALKLDANLVILSACDTAAGVRDQELARASGQEDAGTTLEGLVRAFLAANARAVLATYWQVSAEQESDEFVRTFYARAKGGTIGQALQEAQRGLIATPAYSHPFYWAPYFLVGDSGKPLLTPPAMRVARR